MNVTSPKGQRTANIGGPFLVSIISHSVLFLMIGGNIIFEGQVIRSEFILEDLIPVASNDTLMEDDDILIEEVDDVSLEIPAEDDLSLEEVNTSSAPNVSALVNSITSTSTIDTGFNISIPEGAMLEIGAGAKVISKESSVSELIKNQTSKVSSRVRFFDIETEASNLVYIIDLSQSMYGKRLTLLKKELVQSFRNLEVGTQVSIICFAGNAWLFGTDRKEFATKKLRRDKKVWEINKDWKSPKPKWISVTKDTKLKLIRYAEKLDNEDLVWGTTWETGFNLGSALPTKPDAVFFMTDGITASGKLPTFKQRTQQWAQGSRFPIHGIYLGSSDKSSSDFETCLSFLKNVVKSTKGTFKQKDY